MLFNMLLTHALGHTNTHKAFCFFFFFKEKKGQEYGQPILLAA